MWERLFLREGGGGVVCMSYQKNIFTMLIQDDTTSIFSTSSSTFFSRVSFYVPLAAYLKTVCLCKVVDTRSLGHILV